MTLDQVEIVKIVLEVRPGRPALSGEREDVQRCVAKSP
jgi:hypothetical protein